mmetsp:Transcript_81777/g.243899  ORF Transcript_81777/g.243899 Transcript_81777/m.243899 type:complete len:223 (+) Transcript_81777:536-1204(+)
MADGLDKIVPGQTLEQRFWDLREFAKVCVALRSRGRIQPFFEVGVPEPAEEALPHQGLREPLEVLPRGLLAGELPPPRLRERVGEQAVALGGLLECGFEESFHGELARRGILPARQRGQRERHGCPVHLPDEAPGLRLDAHEEIRLLVPPQVDHSPLIKQSLGRVGMIDEGALPVVQPVEEVVTRVGQLPPSVVVVQQCGVAVVGVEYLHPKPGHQAQHLLV